MDLISSCLNEYVNKERKSYYVFEFSCLIFRRMALRCFNFNGHKKSIQMFHMLFRSIEFKL